MNPYDKFTIVLIPKIPSSLDARCNKRVEGYNF